MLSCCTPGTRPSRPAGRVAARRARATVTTEAIMSIARITEISSTSTKGFEDAIQQGVQRASQTLRNVRSAWVKEQQVRVENGGITEFQVNLMVTFVLDEDQKDKMA
jgi:flavin-binding protein dodecin